VADRGKAVRIACLEFGWCIEGEEWRAKVPRNGKYKVVLGIHGKSMLPGSARNFEVQVNGKRGACTILLDPQELTFPSVQVHDNFIKLQGKWPRYFSFYYVRISEASEGTVPVSSAPQEFTVPAFDREAYGNGLVGHGAPADADVMFWSVRKTNLPFCLTPAGMQPPSPGQMLRKFLESRLGPEGGSLLHLVRSPLRHEEG
jgi:hypothetical protein